MPIDPDDRAFVMKLVRLRPARHVAQHWTSFIRASRSDRSSRRAHARGAQLSAVPIDISRDGAPILMNGNRQVISTHVPSSAHGMPDLGHLMNHGCVFTPD